MITRLVCWLVGHKFYAKAYMAVRTGTFNPITGVEGHFYRLERQKFCLRCGLEPEDSCST